MTIKAEHIAHIVDELPERFQSLLDEILAFVDRADPGHRAFQHSNTKERRFLLAYHLCKNTLLVTRGPGGEITGLALWYEFHGPWTWGQIDRWRPDDKGGEEFVLSHFIATSKEARTALVKGMKGRATNEKNVTALRKGKTVRFSPKNIQRFQYLN